MTTTAETYHQPARSIDDIWRVLDDVPDPEIPVISIVDLGIVRDVAWQDDKLVVTVTPTYSGCPATSVINFEIEKALNLFGVSNVVLKRQLAPPWTTSWLSEKGRRKLLEYGIAPPLQDGHCGSGGSSASQVACPRCASTDTVLVSQFGSTPCKSAWRCSDCLEPFDQFKCI